MSHTFKRYVALTIIVLLLAPAAASARPGRRVYLGKFAGIVRCESEGDAQARNHWSGADGLFQFMPSTWRAVAARRERPRLARKVPSSVTVARQLKQALWLRDNVGIRQWTCWRNYGRGSSWVWITNEIEPRDPAKCARQLRRKYGRSKRLANSVCGVA